MLIFNNKLLQYETNVVTIFGSHRMLCLSYSDLNRRTDITRSIQNLTGIQNFSPQLYITKLLQCKTNVLS